jgi:hypothetical protein
MEVLQTSPLATWVRRRLGESTVRNPKLGPDGLIAENLSRFGGKKQGARGTAATLALLVSFVGLVGCRRDPPPQPSHETPAATPAETSGTRDAGRFAPAPRCVVIGTSSVDSGVAPLTVVFTAEGMCTYEGAKFLWDFGDGSSPVESREATHTYFTPGDYTARVEISDAQLHAGDADELSIAVTAP